MVGRGQLDVGAVRLAATERNLVIGAFPLLEAERTGLVQGRPVVEDL